MPGGEDFSDVSIKPRSTTSTWRPASLLETCSV